MIHEIGHTVGFEHTSQSSLKLEGYPKVMLMGTHTMDSRSPN